VILLAKLGICIPTYNRAEYLSELLDSIYSGNNLDDVNISVRNNASKDNTVEICDRYDLSLVNLTETIPGDINVMKAYESICDDYVWVIGDDELIPNGGIDYVLRMIDLLKPSMINCGNPERIYKDFREFVSLSKISDKLEPYYHPLMKSFMISS